MLSCDNCGACCKFIKLPADGLTQDIRSWLDMHEGIRVVGNEILIFARCKNLKADNRCGIYEQRPKICRDYKLGGDYCREARRMFFINLVPVSSEVIK